MTEYSERRDRINARFTEREKTVVFGKADFSPEALAKKFGKAGEVYDTSNWTVEDPQDPHAYDALNKMLETGDFGPLFR